MVDSRTVAITWMGIWLLSGFHQSCSTLYYKPDLFWSDRIVIVSGRVPLQGKLLSRVSNREEFTILPSGKGEFRYRVSLRDKEAMLRAGYVADATPPFAEISPDIVQRRNSSNLKKLWNGYKDNTTVEAIFKIFQQLYPDESDLRIIGRSVRGRPIYALILSRDVKSQTDKPVIFFNGSHHGSEPLTIDYVLDIALLLLASTHEEPANDHLPESIAQYAKEHRDKLQYYLSHFRSVFVPVVNPDGVDNFWNRTVASGRKNGRDTLHAGNAFDPRNGVDLNRNYPFLWNSGIESASSNDPASVFYRGKSAASEPETRAMMALLDKERPVISLSYHCFATRVLVPYTADGAVNPYPSAAIRAGEALAKAGSSNRDDKNYEAVRNIYSVDGTDQDYIHFKYGTLAYIVEGSYLTPWYPTDGIRSIEGMRRLSLESYEVYRRGPTITVHSRDRFDNPVQARVTFPDVLFQEGESFTTDARNGRMDYILFGGGYIPVEVTAGKHKPMRKEVLCESGTCQVGFHTGE